MELNDQTIYIAYICDENFALPTGVSLYSLLVNRDCANVYSIYILCSGVTQQSKDGFKSLQSGNFKITIVDLPVLDNLESLTIDSVHVSVTALYKFWLPYLFSDLDRILYIDGDTLILQDLLSLFNQDIQHSYVAAVSDRFAFFYRGKTFQERIDVDYDNYFNSGVMLLNLAKMRVDHMTEKLLDHRIAGHNDFMDQDAFNAVLGSAVTYLPLVYNSLSTCIADIDYRHLNTYYPGSHLGSLDDCFKKAFIYHFASPAKPWKYSNVEYGNEWHLYLQSSPFELAQTDLDIYKPREIERRDNIREKMRHSTGDFTVVSIIMPVYNSQKTLDASIASILLQNNFENLELICIDDGSTDNSPYILKAWERRDPRVVIVTQPNLSAGAARNAGVLIAKGRYILFIDSDDKLASGEILANAIRIADRKKVDILCCSADVIDQDGHLLEPAKWCLRMDMVPTKSVFKPDDLREKLYLFSGGSPWSKIFRRDFIVENRLYFLTLKRSEDFYFVQLALSKAQRIAAFDQPLTHYRVHSVGSLENTKDETPCIFWEADMAFYASLKELGLYDVFEKAAKFASLHRIHYNLKMMRTIEGFLEVYDLFFDIHSFIHMESWAIDDPLYHSLWSQSQSLLTKSPYEYIFNLYLKATRPSLMPKQKRICQSQDTTADKRLLRMKKIFMQYLFSLNSPACFQLRQDAPSSDVALLMDRDLVQEVNSFRIKLVY